jgi:hypothetical protein
MRLWTFAAAIAPLLVRSVAFGADLSASYREGLSLPFKAPETRMTQRSNPAPYQRARPLTLRFRRVPEAERQIKLAIFQLSVEGAPLVATRRIEEQLEKFQQVYRQCSVAIEDVEAYTLEVAPARALVGTMRRWALLDPAKSNEADFRSQWPRRPGWIRVVFAQWVGAMNVLAYAAPGPRNSDGIVYLEASASIVYNDLLSHELGHLLIDEGGHNDEKGEDYGPDYLMHPKAVFRDEPKLDARQCARIRKTIDRRAY